MTGFALYLSLGASLAAIWYLLVPLRYKKEASPSTELLLDTDRENRCVQVLRDLELDYRTGKIPLQDYEETKARLELELLALLPPSSESKA